MTMLCEYTGEVDFSANHLLSENDSIMELLRTSSSETSLVIIPNRYSNLARFISGINNHSK